MKYFLLIIIFFVQFSTSIIFANQWSTPMIVVDTLVYEPQLEIDNYDNLHLIFDKDIPDSALDIFYTYFDGNSWATPLNISNSEKLSLNPRTCIDKENRLYVIWGEANIQSSEHHKTYITNLLYSNYDRQAWSEPMSYYHTEFDSGTPPGVGNIVTSHNNLVHLVWTDIPHIKYTFLKNDTISEIQNIRFRGSAPDIYADNDNTLHVAYIGVPEIIGYNRSDVFYFYYTEADNAWSDSVLVYYNPNQYSYYPQIISDARSRIHIAWLEDEDLNIYPNDIYHSFSDDGINWSEAYDVSHHGGNTYGFDIAMDSKGFLHVVWDQSVDYPLLSVDHIFYAVFDGASWSEPERITPAGKRMGGAPTIAVDSQDYLHVVWAGKVYEGDEWKLLYSTTRPPTQVVQHEKLSQEPAVQLYNNYPNPFNTITHILFSMPYSTEVSLTIVDLMGRHVKSLLAKNILSQGDYNVRWDGTDETGKRVASGIYLYRLKAQKFLETRKMILLF